MARILKSGITSEQAAEEDAKVRKVVEGVLADIEAGGDAAVREYSEKFDNWSPESFHLSKAQIAACYDQVSDQNIEDIEFAQAQIRQFAEIQKSALQDVERETFPASCSATRTSRSMRSAATCRAGAIRWWRRRI